MYQVMYKNNLDRFDPQIVSGDVTPRQLIQDHGVSLGNYTLQINGIPLTTAEADSTFDQIAAAHPDISTDKMLVLSGVKPANGGRI